MGFQETSFAFYILLFLSNQMLGTNLSFVSCQCIEKHKVLLLDLRNNLTYNTSLSTKLVEWNDETTDCCQWNGVKCDLQGRVIGLELNNESISGVIDVFFRFEFLHSLNLAENFFESVLPTWFGSFANLSYLNLSNSALSGPVPLSFSKLSKLDVLDLSSTYPSLFLENPDLRTLIRNFSRLTELRLDGVKLSTNGYDWCSALSSSLTELRVLSLAYCQLTGPFISSLTKLKSLEIIHLDENNFSAPFAEFFADTPKLRVLSLEACYLSGLVPGKLFQIATLQTVDLNHNWMIEGSLPEFHLNSSLQNIFISGTKFSGRVPETIGRLRMLSQLDLSDNNFSGNVPETIGRLTMLSWLDLSACNFSGSIPNIITNLTQLEYFDLSNNHFTGPVPSFNSLRNLAQINLGSNGLSGQTPDSFWDGLDKLSFLDLRNNFLEGEVPLPIFHLRMLKILTLSSNRFNGSIRDWGNYSSISLEEVRLDRNNLEGPVPPFFFNLYNLSTLSLAMNRLNGSLDLAELAKLKGLMNLDLSYNSLSVHMSENISMSPLFPRLMDLRLVSCNLQRVPVLKNQSSLWMLDLSENNIEGEIPNWLWEAGNAPTFMNLSHNLFTSLQEPYDLSKLGVLDLHSNMLGGQIPLPPPSASFVDLSNNNFSSPLPPNIGIFLTQVSFFSIANNSIIGTIPVSLCNASSIEILDLSNNGLHGRIPSCLVEETLVVLNLRRNNLTGNLPDMFPHRCSLKTLDLSSNGLEGQIPVSLSRCSEMEVLNLGNNYINDTFPCFRNLSQLHVLALRSNAFYGSVTCLKDNNTSPNLQIIDIASNNFDGVLPWNLFSNLEAMKGYGTQTQLEHLSSASLVSMGYYQDSVIITVKGKSIDLRKILNIFTTIDFSNNHFQGAIPDTIGELESLYVLDLSHNALSGQIPASVGNLQKLESLDLSFNNLGGGIPQQLASLTFLSFLNLSHNRLTGRIPQGSQMQTFLESSFTENEGLCGFQLNRSCRDITTPHHESGEEQKNSSDYEILLSVALGFLVGLGIIFTPLLFPRGAESSITSI